MTLCARRFLLFSMCVLGSRTAAAQQYVVTDLGTLSPTAINDLGHVAGISIADSHVSVWMDGVASDLGLLPGATACVAMSINNSDQVVGFCNEVNTSQAFQWTARTGMTALSIPMPAAAYAINEQGDVTGTYACSDTGRCAFLYQRGAVAPLGICTSCTGISVNDSDQVVGLSPFRPMMWDRNGEHDLGTLDDATGLGAANAISGDGLAAGRSTTGVSGESHAVLWTPFGISNLGTLGGPGAEARAIKGNLVVGTSSTAAGDSHAFFYDNNGPGFPLDLNDLIPADSGWVLARADGINASGQIVGSGTVNDSSHGFLLTPIRTTGSSR